MKIKWEETSPIKVCSIKYFKNGKGFILKAWLYYSHDLSQTEIEISTCKAEQIHKMPSIFNRNNNLKVLFSESTEARNF